MPAPHPAEAVIAALLSQRDTLGHEGVDFSVAAIRQRLGALELQEPRLRQVSVMFCDIVESTSLLAHLDTEDVLAAVAAPLRHFGGLIEAAGGRVLRFTGDGFKAAFGMAQSREDDAERAVDTGLAILQAAREHAAQMQQAFGITRFAVRVGINTGAVVLGGGIEADDSAMGHAVHIAARMEQAAPAGHLLISNDTAQLVRGRFRLQAQPLLKVKGAEAPMLTHLVEAALPRAQRVVQRGVDDTQPTPLVGRTAELQQLQHALLQTAATRRMHAATVLADAGIGKSRLALELLRTLAPQSVWTARAQPASQLQTYGLLRDLLMRRCAMADDEDGASARHIFVQTLAPLIGERGETQARLIGRLVGLDFPDDRIVSSLSGRELRDRAWRALRRVFEGATAHDAPLVLLLDDLHWADAASLEFLQGLLLQPLNAPVFMLGLARPALLEREADWPEDSASHQRLHLSALSATDGHVLARALLQRLPEPPTRLIELLSTRAAGNPFYMEELLRMLIDDGVVRVGDGGAWQLQTARLDIAQLPPTLVGVLQARLDALPPAARQTLQRASIVGPVFWTDALALLDAEAAASLPLLLQRQLLAAHADSAFDGSPEYAFHHTLLHEVTYGTVLKAQRREGHAACARWLAQRVGTRGGEFVAVTADHFEKAGDSASALSYFERAAREANARGARRTADAYCERALRQPALTDMAQRFSLIELRWSCADALGRSDEATALLQAQDELAETADDDGLRATVAAQRALHADRHGDLQGAAALARRAVALGEKAGAVIAATLGHGELAWLDVNAGRHDAAEVHLERARAWAARFEPGPRSRTRREDYEMMLGQITVESLLQQQRSLDALALLEHLATIEGADVISRCGLLERQTMIAIDLGDAEATARCGQQFVELATEAEMPRHRAAAFGHLAEGAARRGDGAALARHIADAEAVLKDHAYPVVEGKLAALRGLLLADQRRFAEAAQASEQAAAQLDKIGSGMASNAHAHAAWARWRAGDEDRARSAVEPMLAGFDDLHDAGAVNCWQVLHAAGDTRAPALRDRLRQRLQGQLQHVPQTMHAALVRNTRHWQAMAAADV